jgi:hypothetical protein
VSDDIQAAQDGLHNTKKVSLWTAFGENVTGQLREVEVTVK